MIRNLDIGDALSALRPNCEYMLEGENYSGITWLDKNQSLPTEKEVELKLVEIKYQEEVNAYREKRKLEYPDWADQLDQIYHNGIDVWKADVKAIKNKYPKQTMDATELQKRKDAALFNLQKRDYEKAIARLAQYELSAGFKDVNGNYTIDPLPLYVPEIGRNPLVVQDEKEREEAREVINNTPQAVIDSINT